MQVLVHLIEIPFFLWRYMSQRLQFDGGVLWVVLLPDDAVLALQRCWCAKRGRVVGGGAGGGRLCCGGGG